jgi:hypothetical protein
MVTTRRRFLGGLIAAVAVTATPFPANRASGAAAAPLHTALPVHARQGAGWVPLGPEAQVKRLYAPASGALFAATDKVLFRSDDAGSSWRLVEVPPSHHQQRAFEVDPTDHRVIYADADDGLQRSDDEGATWATIMPSTRPTNRIVASPADPRILYLGQSAPMSGDFWFHRSFDRGQTWEQLEEAHNSMCGWGFRVLHAHPTDPTRLFRTAGCYAGRDLSDVLEESRDNARTFQTVLSPKGAFPEGMVGGGGSEPPRFYTVVNNDQRNGGGSSIQGSADDGATWSPILEHPPAKNPDGSPGGNTSITGLAYDPASPTRVFAAQTWRSTPSAPWEFGGVVATQDGGATWLETGQPASMPYVTQLALGIDGQYLFAATATGVWRIALG